MELNYNIDDWKERLKIVENIAENSGGLNANEIEALGTYVLYAYEKEMKLKKSVRREKKFHTKRLKEKLATGTNLRTAPKVLSREEKMELGSNNESYYELIDYLDDKGREVGTLKGMEFKSVLDLRTRNPYIKQKLKEAGITTNSKAIYDELNADIKASMQEFKMDINVSQGMISNVDKLAELELDYSNKELLKVMVKNYQSFCVIANKRPDTSAFCIKEDLKKAFESVTLTKAQASVLDRVLNGEVLTKGNDILTFYRVIDKLVKYFE